MAVLRTSWLCAPLFPLAGGGAPPAAPLPLFLGPILVSETDCSDENMPFRQCCGALFNF